MSDYLTSTDESEDRFYVQFDSAEVRLMTLDELDEAFQSGLIHENTYVLREGDTEWLTLSKVAGLDEEPEPQAVPQRVPTSPNSAVYHGPSWPPAATKSSPFAAVGSVAIAPTAGAPRSVIPVVQDVRASLSDLDFESPFKKKRRWPLVAALAVVVIGGGAFAGTKLQAVSMSAGLNASAATPALLTARPSTAPAAQHEDPAPAAIAKADPPASSAETSSASDSARKPASAETTDSKKSDSADSSDRKSADNRLSDDVKRALLNQDQDRTQKRKARAPAPRAARRGGGKTSVAAGFKNGGSKYDPLNGKL